LLQMGAQEILHTVCTRSPGLNQLAQGAMQLLATAPLADQPVMPLTTTTHAEQQSMRASSGGGAVGRLPDARAYIQPIPTELRSSASATYLHQASHQQHQLHQNATVPHLAHARSTGYLPGPDPGMQTAAVPSLGQQALQHQPVNRPLEIEFASVAQLTPAVTPALHSQPPQHAARYTGTAGPHTSAPAPASAVHSSATGAYTGVLESVQGGGIRWRAPQTPGTEVTSRHLSSETRDVLAAKRQERAAAAGGPAGSATDWTGGGAGVVHAVAAQLPATADDWLLAPVALSPSDEQYLFEHSTRLRHMENVRVSGPAAQVRAARSEYSSTTAYP
jgi:hypothetical protein